ncbi:MAG: ABC transporter ATP-binding protein [Pseudomonadota bacterium]
MTVEIEGVTKRFGAHTAVDDVTVRLNDGEFFTVLGPSGCGKSTLLRLVAGLETLDAGSIALSGVPVSGKTLHVPPEDRRVGVVFQSYALWPHMSVRDNVAFPAEAQGASRNEARLQADSHLATVDLTGFAERLPAALSGGQRQRVALARCLAGGAETVLMDEPLANLDPHLRHRMEGEIARFHCEAGVTTLYITHDQREAMALADRVAVMWNGRLLQVAPPREIHERPASEQVARFIGRAAVLDATVRGATADLGPLSAPLTATAHAHAQDILTHDFRARIVIRPGDVALGAGAPARLEAAFYRGGIWEAEARVEGLAETLPVAAEQPLYEGEQVGLSLTSAWALPPEV